MGRERWSMYSVVYRSFAPAGDHSDRQVEVERASCAIEAGAGGGGKPKRARSVDRVRMRRVAAGGDCV